jgi:hypothetical protein
MYEWKTKKCRRSKQTSESTEQTRRLIPLTGKIPSNKSRQRDAHHHQRFSPDLFACMFLSGRRSISLLVDQQAAAPASAVSKFRAAWAVVGVAVLAYSMDRPVIVPSTSAPPCLPLHLLQQLLHKVTAAVVDAVDLLGEVDGICDRAAAAGRRYSPRRTASAAAVVAA